MSKDKPDDHGLDPEAVALSKVVGALGELESDAQQRVLRYAAERFKISAVNMVSTSGAKAIPGVNEQPGPLGIASSSQFTDEGELIEHAQPKTGLMRALVVGYWLQVCQGQQNFSGQEVNDSLKALGHQSANITADMTKLMKKKPSLIQQVAKSGKARQARKRYRLTNAGIIAVTKMLSGESEEGEE